MSDDNKIDLDKIESLNSREKEQLVNLSVKAGQEIIKKAKDSGKKKNTSLDIAEVDGVFYRLVASRAEENKNQKSTVEDRIRSIGLTIKSTTKLIDQYEDGHINNNHVRDIQKLNLGDDLSKLDSDTQERVTENTIKNRNEQNSINSEEASIHVIKGGIKTKFIVDIWYRGMLRLIEKLSIHSDVDEETIDLLSAERRGNLRNKLLNLITKLERLSKILDKPDSKSA